MHLLTVIPIARGIGKENLSYFSAAPVRPGSLVSVPVRSKFLNAVVISSEDARASKSEIRSADFAMKKIGELKSERFLSEGFMRAVRAAADFHAASVGSILGLLVPKAVLESPVPLPSGETAPSAKMPNMAPERLVLQNDPEERYSRYRSIIREEFARGRSVFFLAPDAEDAARALKLLGKGIEKYAYGFHPYFPKKKLLACQKNALSENHPTLTAATYGFFSLCPGRVGAVIVENESSRLYKSRARPRLDARVFAEFFAREIGAKLILGDTLLRTETLWKFREGELAELAPVKWRSLSAARFTVADMTGQEKAKPKSPGRARQFEAIGEELEALIKNSHEKNERLFVFSSRRGLATQIVCRDCGEIVLCGLCRSPMALHRSQAGNGNQNFFLCHICGDRRSAEERCKHCDSWKLEPLGVGSELVFEEVKRKFPSLKVFRIDKDAAPRSSAARREAEKFYSSSGTVLVGTETALLHLDGKIENSAVASLDSLFSLPDFRARERIMRILIKIRSFTSNRLLVQTRAPDEKVIEYALKGNLMDFYRDEIAGREKFNYPPFKTLIKISLSGNRSKVMVEMEKLKKFLTPFEIETFPAFAESARGRFTMHGLIRLERGVWIEKNLLQKLLALPPAFRVEVEPESLL